MAECKTVYVDLSISRGREVKRCTAQGRGGGRPCDAHAKQLAYLQSQTKLWQGYLKIVAELEAKEATKREDRTPAGLRRPA